MPPQAGRDLGAPPPPIPRSLPKGFVFRIRWSRNIAVIAGASFFLVGSILFAAFVSAKSWAALLPLFFMLGGFFMFRIGWREAAATLNAFIRGIAVAGEVVGVALDSTQSINKQHPWKLTNHFPVNGHLHEGRVTSFDSTLAARAAGQPLWVLNVPEDPQQNTLYPPLR